MAPEQVGNATQVEVRLYFFASIAGRIDVLRFRIARCARLSLILSANHKHRHSVQRRLRRRQPPRTRCVPVFPMARRAAGRYVQIVPLSVGDQFHSVFDSDLQCTDSKESSDPTHCPRRDALRP
jgi:hypothetical protein